MTKKIQHLIRDIGKVLQQDPKVSSWDAAVSERLSSKIKELLDKRLVVPTTKSPRSGSKLYMSNIGQPCERKLYYDFHSSKATEVTPDNLLNFLYGDLLEEVVLELAEAAGHTVTGQQDPMYLNGLRGRRDAVIDGMLVDVKTASPASFRKFKEGNLIIDDPFGYRVQLASYLKASQEDPLVTEKDKAAFLVVNKATGEMFLDIHDLRSEMRTLDKLYDDRKDMVKRPTPPGRYYEDTEIGKSGNRKLPFNCQFCDHKQECWPGLRKFAYKTPGPLYLTKVVVEPKVKEIPMPNKGL